MRGVGCVCRWSPATRSATAAAAADLIQGILARRLQILGRQMRAIVHVQLLLIGGQRGRLTALDLLQLLLAPDLVLAVVQLVAAVVHLVDRTDRRLVLALIDGHFGGSWILWCCSVQVGLHFLFSLCFNRKFSSSRCRN